MIVRVKRESLPRVARESSAARPSNAPTAERCTIGSHLDCGRTGSILVRARVGLDTCTVRRMFRVNACSGSGGAANAVDCRMPRFWSFTIGTITGATIGTRTWPFCVPIAICAFIVQRMVRDLLARWTFRSMIESMRPSMVAVSVRCGQGQNGPISSRQKRNRGARVCAPIGGSKDGT
jgi:hypothetical protein